MNEMQGGQTLLISQKKDWGEVFVGYEASNKYVVSDTQGNDLYYAAEVEGSFVLRAFLKAARPFTMVISDPTGQRVISISRPFRPILSLLSVFDEAGQEVGMVKRRLSLFKRRYSIVDVQGNTVFEITGPVFHPWTFNITKNGSAFGQILKKWSGMATEMITDADTFALTINAECDANERRLLLGAVFLIDFVHFEDRGK